MLCPDESNLKTPSIENTPSINGHKRVDAKKASNRPSYGHIERSTTRVQKNYQVHSVLPGPTRQLFCSDHESQPRNIVQQMQFDRLLQAESAFSSIRAKKQENRKCKNFNDVDILTHEILMRSRTIIQTRVQYTTRSFHNPTRLGNHPPVSRFPNAIDF